MTDLTPRQILDAIQRGLEETWRKIDRGETIGDGRVAWPRNVEPGESVGTNEKGPAIYNITPRQILDAMARALDRVAGRFADGKPDRKEAKI